MSDTKALIKYVRDRLNDGPNITFGKPTVLDLVEALEASEGRAEQAEARVHELEGSLSRSISKQSEMADGIERVVKANHALAAKAQTAEANVARLTKERDWLAKALAEDGCPYLALWSDFGSEMRPDWCICIDTADDGFDCNGDPKECWKKEAARRAVAAVEG